MIVMTESKTRIQLLLPADTVAGIDELVERGRFINRQDAVRFLLKNGIENYEDIEKLPPVLKNEGKPYENEVQE